jgi:hypothetical protein
MTSANQRAIQYPASNASCEIFWRWIPGPSHSIRRWKIAKELMKGPVQGIRYIRQGGTDIEFYEYGAVVRFFDPGRDYLFPIPQAERLLNSQLSQNPKF